MVLFDSYLLSLIGALVATPLILIGVFLTVKKIRTKRLAKLV